MMEKLKSWFVPGFVRDATLAALLTLLALAELSVSISSHKMTLRLCTYESLVLALLAAGDLACRFGLTNVRHPPPAKSVGLNYGDLTTGQGLIEKQTESTRARLWCMWVTCMCVALTGLHFEVFMHAVKMLLYTHDIGDHQPPVAVSLYLIVPDLCIKIVNTVVLTFVRDDSYANMPGAVTLGYWCMPGVADLTTALLYKCGLDMAVWLDPLLALFMCVTLSGLLLIPLSRMVPVLLLDSPVDYERNEFLEGFLTKFPLYSAHDVHVWRDTLDRRAVSVHVKCTAESTEHVVTQVGAYMQQLYDATTVCVQPEVLDPRARPTAQIACSDECSKRDACAKARCCDVVKPAHDAMPLRMRLSRHTSRHTSRHISRSISRPPPPMFQRQISRSAECLR